MSYIPSSRWPRFQNVVAVTLFLGFAFVFAGCQRGAEAPPPPPPAVVTAIHPIMYPVQSYFEMNGHLEAVETVQIIARVKGFLEEIRFTEGDEVKQGDLLFRIDQRPYEAVVKKAVADRLKAVAEARKARLEAERAMKLAAKQAISTEEVEQRIAGRESADAIVKQYEALLESAKLEFGYTEIKAPISGHISRALVTKGNLVGQSENTVLTTIVSVDPLFVFFDAPERDLVEWQQLQQKQQMPSVISREYPVEVGVTGEEGYPHVGKIDFRENKVDSGTGTIRLRGRIPNPIIPPGNARLLYPGLYARVRVPAGPPQTLTVIPEDALMTGQEGRYVFVLDKANVVQKRTVTIGPSVWKGMPTKENAPGWHLTATEKSKEIPVQSVIAILKGLEPSDRVVVNGLTRARPGAAVAPEEPEFKAPRAPEKK